MRLFLVSAAIHRGIVTRPTTAQGFPRGMAESSIQPYNATAMVLSANAGSLRPLSLAGDYYRNIENGLSRPLRDDCFAISGKQRV